jgi:hypothetical protein
VFRRIAHRNGERAVFAQMKVLIITSNFRSDSHIRGDVEVRQLRQFLRWFATGVKVQASAWLYLSPRKVKLKLAL